MKEESVKLETSTLQSFKVLICIGRFQPFFCNIEHTLSLLLFLHLLSINHHYIISCTGALNVIPGHLSRDKQHFS